MWCGRDERHELCIVVVCLRTFHFTLGLDTAAVQIGQGFQPGGRLRGVFLLIFGHHRPFCAYRRIVGFDWPGPPSRRQTPKILCADFQSPQGRFVHIAALRVSIDQGLQPGGRLRGVFLLIFVPRGSFCAYRRAVGFGSIENFACRRFGTCALKALEISSRIWPRDFRCVGIVFWHRGPTTELYLVHVCALGVALGSRGPAIRASLAPAPPPSLPPTTVAAPQCRSWWIKRRVGEGPWPVA
jgi:hypothetical protein